MELFGFEGKFVGSIDECISTASFSFQLNGSSYGVFKEGIGIRQGEPL